MTIIKSTIGKFISFVRQTLFCTCVEYEIYHRIAPHTNKEKDCGYPFDSFEALEESASQGRRELLQKIEIIETQAASMGKAYGDAFRHIMYRDLNRRMLPYMNLAHWRTAPALRVPKYA